MEEFHIRKIIYLDQLQNCILNPYLTSDFLPYLIEKLINFTSNKRRKCYKLVAAEDHLPIKLDEKSNLKRKNHFKHCYVQSVFCRYDR